ncbi:MAG: zinc-dependent dehydrogenase [Candidatus Omnitrophica bacterium]|nr:zinc-dependent dehydrogenase [Candidatus Omnitrophota bacterium]MDD5351967.1 zinc-dependent dehydrogenase [Candidatus Omnitrophota bacterium]MDD5550793.1 zinc-dependent dehydrogenase [Candidatus Omnitrophota bacterium]
MKVAMYYSNSDIRIEEKPVPKIGPGELLIRVEASGICGSDVMEWYRADKVPLVLGHEIGGVVTEVGQGVKKYKVGDRVSASHHVPCNECHYCLGGHPTVCETLRRTFFDPGGFCEYLRLPKINAEKGVYLLPDEVSFEEATFIEPVACVLRGQRLSNMKEGKSVLVVGSGIAGLLHIQMAKINKAGLVVATDINDYRLKVAKKVGADNVINGMNEDVSARFKELNKGRLADLVILCTGAPQAIEQALNSVDRGGTVLFFAPTNQGITVPISVNKIFWRTEITLTSSYAGSPEDHLDALELIRRRKINIKDMITHRLKLSQIQVGFKLAVEAKDSLKVIIEPQK